MEERTTPWSGHDPVEDRLRTTVWTQMKVQGAAVGGPVGHIPRFVGNDRKQRSWRCCRCGSRPG